MLHGAPTCNRLACSTPKTKGRHIRLIAMLSMTAAGARAKNTCFFVRRRVWTGTFFITYALTNLTYWRDCSVVIFAYFPRSWAVASALRSRVESGVIVDPRNVPRSDRRTNFAPVSQTNPLLNNAQND
ncbi:uncharacterized protein EDB93DRAFT_221170 [Suillus bovinus]|uniref:uncharacterized protein n=1 Tax=Suillus bovinus TaxID=48563 RepID=UPI001B88311B|nr:uncharacterized protein EDB93DRAFT_221170 [Suillus bovinus]KAG2153517.1 hypothetical protein EDB93DRAFT_221170 [Suillus bovinus]